MARIKIPSPLRAYTNGQLEIMVNSKTAGEALEDLVMLFPALRTHLYDGEGNLRAFVNLFLGEINIRDLQGLETPLDSDTRILLVPSIAGG